jgi:hypothetical protein
MVLDQLKDFGSPAAIDDVDEVPHLQQCCTCTDASRSVSARTGQASIFTINLNLKPCAGHGHGLKWLQSEIGVKFKSRTRIQY